MRGGIQWALSAGGPCLPVDSAAPSICLILRVSGFTLAAGSDTPEYSAMVRSSFCHRLACRLPVLLLAVLATGIVGPGISTAAAQPGSGWTASLTTVAQAYNENVSLDQAVRMVRERTGGRVLRAETRRQNGRSVHRIRVLSDDGRVRTYAVDAETGRIS